MDERIANFALLPWTRLRPSAADPASPEAAWRLTLDEMIAQRDALLTARARAVRTVEVEGRPVSYATDGEMATALADLDRRIEKEKTGARRRIVRTAASKGL